MRVSQAERDQAVEALREHAAEGRLDVDELEQRAERALVARTRAELDEVLLDLPARPSRAPHRRRRPRPAFVLVAVAALATVVFAATGAAGWVVWTALGWALFSLKSGRLACFPPYGRRHSAV